MMRQPTAKQIAEWMDKVRPMLEPMADTYLRDKDIRAIVKACYAAMGSRRIPAPAETAAAYGTLSHLIKLKPSLKILTRNVLRLLANWNFIRDGMRVPEWDGSQTDTDAVILGVARTAAQPGELPSLLVGMKLKTGLCAGIIFCGRFKASVLAWFLQHHSGTANLECAVEEAAGMEVRAVVSCKAGHWRVHDWSCTEGQKKHNRDLAERRMDPRKCPSAPLPCNVCQKTMRECPLAVWLPKPDKEDGK